MELQGEKEFKMKKIFIFLLLGIFLISFSSAWTSDKFVEDTDKIRELDTTTKYGTYTIEESKWYDPLGIITKERLVEKTLTKHNSECLINCESEGTTILYKSGKLFDKLDFYDSRNNNQNINYQIFIKQKEEFQYEVPLYEEFCVEGNTTKELNCQQRIKGYENKTETREVFTQYNYEVLDAGEYDWLIKTQKPVDLSIDWIGTIRGVELKEWAWWNSNWQYKKEIKIKENSNKNLSNYSNLIYIAYDNNMNIDFSDLRFTNAEENTELGYWIQNKTNSSFAWIWVKTPLLNASINNTIYMYYGNNQATSNSNMGSANIYINDFSSNEDLPTASSTYRISSSSISNGNLVISMGGGCDQGVFVFNSGVYGNNFDFKTRISLSSGYHIAVSLGGGTIQAANRQSTGIYSFTAGTGDQGTNSEIGINPAWTYINQVAGGPSLSGYYNITYISEGSAWTYVDDGRRNINTSTITNNGATQYVGLGPNQQYCGAASIAVDYVYLKPYASIEPTYYISSRLPASLDINMIYPTSDISSFTQETFNFTFNLSDYDLKGIKNVSLIVNGLPVVTNTSGLQGFYNFTYSVSSGLYIWYIEAYDNSNVVTRTIARNIIKPIIIIHSGNGTQNYGTLNQNHTINFTIVEASLDKVWYNYNGTNVFLTGVTSAVPKTFNFSLVKDLYSLQIYANDTFGNEISGGATSWNYKVFENSRTSNETSYETAYETYSINLTANSSLTGVNLLYNGTNIGNLINQGSGIWSFGRDLPTSVLGNNSINYNFTYAGDTISSTYLTYQNVLPITLVLCNATFPTRYINFTFKDENTLSNLVNVTMQTATWNYYLGTGTQEKSYVYTSSGVNSSYAFCFSPPNRTLYATPSITYLANDYPARFYTPGTLTLTNTTTNQTLYLLNSGDGIYVTFITVNSFATAVEGASVTVSRLISGSPVTIGQGTTDSSGAYTIWLNPNYQHTIVASKSGFGSTTVSINPTQGSYTLTLTSTSNYTYISNVRGLLWAFFPRERLSASSTNFGFNVSSSYDNIIGCKIELLNNNKSLVLSSAETVAVNNSFCSVQTSYTPSNTYPQIKGRLLVDIGDGYQILEEDAFWFLLDYNTTGSTFTDWFNSIQQLDLALFNNNEQHREFTNILLFFLIVMIIVAVLNQAGWDVQTNGGMIYLVGGMVWFASVPGFLTLSGISPWSLMDKYFVALVYSLFMGGFALRNLT